MPKLFSLLLGAILLAGCFPAHNAAEIERAQAAQSAAFTAQANRMMSGAEIPRIFHQPLQRGGTPPCYGSYDAGISTGGGYYAASQWRQARVSCQGFFLPQ